jgi:hypothetical protein
MSESEIVQLKADATKNATALKAQKDESMPLQGVIARLQQDLAAACDERDKLSQDIEKMSQSEATLQKEFQVQSEDIQTRKVKCGRT